MTNLNELSPFWNSETSGLSRLSPVWGPTGGALERFMNSPFGNVAGSKRTGGAWAPEVDVTETDASYVFKAEIPGVSPEDIKVSVTSNGLTLSGEKSEEEKKEGDNFVRTERRYGSFQRSFAFPAQVDADNVTADAKHGILTVIVNKAKPSKVNTVEVRSK